MTSPAGASPAHSDAGELDRPNLAALTDTALTERFGRLFTEHAPGLQRYLARRVGASAAEDIVAETFLTALRRRASYDPDRAGIRAWLYGIAGNQLKQHERTEMRRLRATSRLAAGDTAGTDHAEAVGDRVDAAYRVGQLAAALSQLPPGDRDVLLLTSWAGLDATEIGQVLHIPPGTVRSRLHRVRRWLRRQCPTTTLHEDGTDD
ncbi:DNA-directed RNA polymerase sigma-70 factor [Actinocatenispora thailandica]|uniref:DNA-directed RNA polymerase sigma-70 factor n=1 Tax=Actinocatenispora thailandica TaxID=227318 RepID=A0A7R7HYC4_9ACTN|nr:sigma-70 family RNA polymerase sigma factor [Actinocatenispora thailandica]BCJ36456.1 DNA-directed RNA polymerase sigma-70 factor [Actinocatenispora thailandica]